MKKRIKDKFQWHIVVIILFILVLSIASWVQFAGEVKSSVDDRLSGGAKTETLSAPVSNTAKNSAEKTSAAKYSAAKNDIVQKRTAKETSPVQSFASAAVPDFTVNAAASVSPADTSASPSAASVSPADAHSSVAAADASPNVAAADASPAAVAADSEASGNSPFSVLRKAGRKIGNVCRLVDKAVDKVDAWFSVYSKKELSKIDTRITYYATREVQSVQVLSGKGKWLFYKTKTDGDPIADYEGTNLYTEKELETAAKDALAVQEELAERGTKLALLVVPNKENIYSEYMPDTYVKADQTRSDILVESLSEKGVNIVSPKQELLDEHSSTQIYYYYDTHWNQLGSYIGVRKVLSSLGITIPEFSERTYSSKNLYGNFHYCGQDDLAKMAGLRSVFTDEIEYEVDGTVLMEWPDFEYQQSHQQVSHFTNEDAPHKESIFLIGDSFRPAMVPALREQFADVYVILQNYYTPQVLEDIDPDYLIVEYAERFSHRIKRISSLLK